MPILKLVIWRPKNSIFFVMDTLLWCPHFISGTFIDDGNKKQIAQTTLAHYNDLKYWMSLPKYLAYLLHVWGLVCRGVCREDVVLLAADHPHRQLTDHQGLVTCGWDGRRRVTYWNNVLRFVYIFLHMYDPRLPFSPELISNFILRQQCHTNYLDLQPAAPPACLLWLSACVVQSVLGMVSLQQSPVIT